MKYTIKNGDTLGDIARRFMGDAGQHKRLWRDNEAVLVRAQKRFPRLKGPNWIYPGTVIEVPTPASPSGAFRV